MTELLIRVCDLCLSEDDLVTIAKHQYSNPDVLDGAWFDSCRTHRNQMRDTGGYKFRKIELGS